MNMESIYEYGSRAGFWRLHRMFTDRGHAGDRLRRRHGARPAIMKRSAAMKEADWEIASHGLKWIDYQYMERETERAAHGRGDPHPHRGYRRAAARAGTPGACSPNTLALVAEEGGFLYCADSYADDLPYWARVDGRSQLVVPYTLDANDMRFATAQGFNSGDQFFAYLKDSFDVLLRGRPARQPEDDARSACTAG